MKSFNIGKWFIAVDHGLSKKRSIHWVRHKNLTEELKVTRV